MSSSLKDYWERVADEFDSCYREEKKALQRIVDRVFRKGIRERFDLTLQECNEVSGKRILDIGCGSGRISVELARRGGSVVGIDYSRNMLNLACRLAQKFRVVDECEFIWDDFLRHIFREQFSISIALGFFDYTRNPLPYLEKMKLLTTEKCIMSFPCKFSFQTPIRMIWLKRRKCPVFFYSKGEVSNILSRYFHNFAISTISADYFCVARSL